jgi:hypothetical protein
MILALSSSVEREVLSLDVLGSIPRAPAISAVKTVTLAGSG